MCVRVWRVKVRQKPRAEWGRNILSSGLDPNPDFKNFLVSNFANMMVRNGYASAKGQLSVAENERKWSLHNIFEHLRRLTIVNVLYGIDHREPLLIAPTCSVWSDPSKRRGSSIFASSVRGSAWPYLSRRVWSWTWSTNFFHKWGNWTNFANTMGSWDSIMKS